MGDVLSQSEIDALLQSMMSGETITAVEVTKKEARNYDFHRPAKFNKEHLRSLENIFDNYCRLLSSFLTAYLRTSTQIIVASSEPITYGEFNNTLVNPVILTILEFLPLKGSIVLEMSANIGYAIIDRILGGPGLGVKKLRDFSEIEKILLERVINQALNFIPESWENIGDFKPRIEKIETNSQFAQIIQPNEMCALVTLSIKIGSVEGMINFCIPHIVVEPIMDKLNTKYWFSGLMDTNEGAYADSIEPQLERAKIDVAAVIGRTRITVNDFVNLQIGDIIPLDSYINSDLQVMVGSLLKFTAKPGISRGKNAIQITSLVEREV